MFMTLLLAGVALALALCYASRLFHILAYFASVANVTNNDTAALTDSGIIPITNGHFIPPAPYSMFAAYVGTTTLTRARLNSGTIRQVNPFYLEPINVAILPGSNPNIVNMRQYPKRIVPHEELALEITTTGVGPQNLYAVLWWEKSYEAAPQGDIWSFRASGTATLTASAWTIFTYTLETSLPAGVYDVINFRCFTTNLIAARIVFDNQFERPGVLGFGSEGNRLPYIWDQNYFGKFGTFRTYSLPRLEALANVADTAEEAFFYVVKQPGVAA